MIFVAVVLAVFLSKATLQKWRVEFWDEFFDTLGIGLVFFGFLFRIAARGYKKEESLSGKKLVKGGPYALVRNPMYFGTLIIGTGVISVIFELWTLPLFLIIFLLIYAPQITKEEARLLEFFGEEYTEYCKATPKYFPRVSDLLNLRQYLRLKFSWVRRESLSFLLAITIVMGIEIWEDIRLFGRKGIFSEFVELSVIILFFIVTVSYFLKKTRR